MTFTLVSPAVPSRFLLDPTILAGQLAPASLTGDQRDVAAYQRFFGNPQRALEATSLAQETRLSPHTINRRLAAVKRLMQEAAAQAYVEGATAEAFRRIKSVPVKALKNRTKLHTSIRLTPGQMRQLCGAPDPRILLGRRDRALLHTLATSGCRVSEVVTLTASQLTVRDGRFFLQILGKNDTEARDAPLILPALPAGATGR